MEHKEKELLDLNDDCFTYLCRYLEPETIVNLSKTCTRLKAITERRFRYKTYYSCCIGSRRSEITVLRTLRELRRYLKRFDLMFDVGYEASYTKLFALLNQEVEESHLIELSILGEVCNMPLASLAPIFGKLEVLTLQNICFAHNCVATVNLPAFCRNYLKRLTVSGQIIFAPVLHKEIFGLLWLDADFTTGMEPEDFFLDNPQLKHLYLRNRRNVINISLNTFSGLLPVMEDLGLDVTLIRQPVRDLPELAHFGSLTSLGLYRIPEALFSDVVGVVKTLQRLRKVVLQSNVSRANANFTAIQESLVGIPNQLAQLRSFVTVSIDWTPETVSDFVVNARNLEYLDFWSSSESNYTVTPQFIRTLARNRRLTLNPRPLQLKMYSQPPVVKKVN